MAGDASAFGLGAVLSHIHVNSDGSEHTIAFVSRTLSVTEQNYAQIENEALSSIFGIQKFHTNLYEHKFTSITDHKPLDYFGSQDRHTYHFGCIDAEVGTYIVSLSL